MSIAEDEAHRDWSADRLAPRFRMFPDTDSHLALEVQAAYRAAPDDLDEAPLVEFVESRLRRSYRLLRIHMQHPLGRPLTGAKVWYVLRDGAVRRPNAELDRLYGAIGVARDLVRRTGHSLERACDIARDAGFEDEAEAARVALRERLAGASQC